MIVNDNASIKTSTKTSTKTNAKTSIKTSTKIIEIIRHDPYVSAQKLAESIGITKKGIDWQISKLKKLGIIQREGGRKGGKWVVVEG